MKYPEEIRKDAIERVKTGESMKHVAETIGASVATIQTWCKSQGVHSRIHVTHQTDENVIRALKKLKVAKAGEIAKELGCKTINPRLRRMVLQNKIKMRRIAKATRSPVKPYFYKYFNCSLYYLSEKDFIDWIEKRTRRLPKHLRKAFHHFLKSTGINIPEQKQEKKNISVSVDLHDILYERAQAEHTTIEDYIRKVIE